MPRKTCAKSRRIGISWAASMRPRPDAAENGAGPRGPEVDAVASMRPRPDAAENNASASVPKTLSTLLQ